ncbi:hypothetical protein [Larkinella soli]|uniref:hypothetical protein n=1 Tax=Larkinella soli TaxID=1770527 RepID=UPI000FFC04FF|nr:hypothetical protein [Larkinella soli]
MKAGKKKLASDIAGSIETRVNEVGGQSKKVKKAIEKSAEKLADKLTKLFKKEEKKREKEAEKSRKKVKTLAKKADKKKKDRPAPSLKSEQADLYSASPESAGPVAVGRKNSAKPTGVKLLAENTEA